MVHEGPSPPTKEGDKSRSLGALRLEGRLSSPYWPADHEGAYCQLQAHVWKCSDGSFT